MCDTFVALAEATPTGATVFAKNSDREPTEPQGLEYVPAAEHPEGSLVFTSSARLPQVARTHALLLSRPYWLWGAEMGVNEHGVVAGNEAVFTKLAARRRAGEALPCGKEALLGMDIVRLVLERATSAQAAAQLAGDLIEGYGQFGAGHSAHTPDYDNSFLFADPDSAWTLESAGAAWVSKRVTGVYAISNRLRLASDWDRSSAGIAAYARDLGLRVGRGRLDFAATFSDPVYTWAAAAAPRQTRAEMMLSATGGVITAERAFEVLRDHGAKSAGSRWAQPLAGRRASICAHASWLPQRRAAQTTASLVVDFGQAAQNPALWVTATSAPCTSLFKPLWLDVLAQRPTVAPAFPSARPDDSPWWRHQRLLALAKRDHQKFLAEFEPRRRALERELMQQQKQAQSAGVEGRLHMVQSAWQRDAELELELLGRGATVAHVG